jgi:hypothetical protein
MKIVEVSMLRPPYALCSMPYALCPLPYAFLYAPQPCTLPSRLR